MSNGSSSEDHASPYSLIYLSETIPAGPPPTTRVDISLGKVMGGLRYWEYLSYYDPRLVKGFSMTIGSPFFPAIPGKEAN